ncbi:hypothetical protein COX47_00555 [Candidatus Roizmanbacteria bacterium CG23_combo_of_CG06-09_8_20_14_all_35_49]|uniref:Uncharacterized protein n=1 Tax=Candidatus Roizmanbacteria bacterium CG23_combo_of_CG06-09_8_20_14_all_35_49 TaxID=1974863 RepID=A0A2G9Y7U1_9BACT|nr:MAG: hypothetical protein COX47_00555 [Candidatus Roizmanbacteria bacterium CG23_combo_of_CG06-09_8_20_14_all_35_49]
MENWLTWAPVEGGVSALEVCWPLPATLVNWLVWAALTALAPKVAPIIVRITPNFKAFFLVIFPSSLVRNALRFFFIFGILSI